MTLYVYPPAPGTREYSLPHLQRVGPCEKPCDHTDCERMRRDAEAMCLDCGQPIGYDRHIIPTIGWPAQAKLVHASCYRGSTVQARRYVATQTGYEIWRVGWRGLPGLSTRHVQDELRVSRPTITHWIRQGKLKAKRMQVKGAKKWEYRIDEEDLIAFKRSLIHGL